MPGLIIGGMGGFERQKKRRKILITMEDLKMAISGIGQSYYQNNVETKRNTKNVNDTEKFALEKTDGTKELSKAEEMEIFKKEFYEALSQITNHRTVSNAAVNISEAAFRAMKDDPQYREKILSLIQRDWGDSYA